MAKTKNKFAHLHVHTEYSLLDGLSKIDSLFSYVREQGMEHVAMTDHGVMYGAVEFYKKAEKYGVKPIIGMEAYVVEGDMTERTQGEQRYHQLLLARDNDGYKNLMELTSRAHIDGYYYKPRVDLKTLKKYSKGLIATSTCAAGQIPKALADDDMENARKLLNQYLDIFGENYYLELQKHFYDEHAKNAINTEIRTDLINMAENEKKVNGGLIKLGKELKVPLIATNDAHYIKKEDASAQDALVCISTGKNVSDIKRLRFIDAPSYYISSPDEMAEWFEDTPECLTNTLGIAEKCDVSITLGKFFFPKVELKKDETAEEVLGKAANEGMRDKYDEVTPVLQERLDYELKVINDKGYPAYFLIFKDMTDWAHANKIPINTRGSAAGSLVSYCLGVTSVDPIKYLLPFERFLNPFRPSAPDIDLDIADSKREEMLAYLVEKYGENKVAQICTFGRMLAKGSVRDVARVLGYPYDVGDSIAKIIPEGSQGFPMSIDRGLEESQELADRYARDADAKRVIDLSKQVEGNARHISVHAAGVVISPTELTDFTPLQVSETGGVKKLITQYEMHAVEDVGLVKLDVLGIRNLAILQDAVLITEANNDVTIDLRKIPLDDKKTFEMLARGETMGVFQLSGGGMTKHLINLKPEQIEDLMIMVALYRPGPMMNIEEYIARKHGKKKVEYYHPKMEKFLDKSLGVLVYQDDLLYTALELAGYDWEEVDKFRKAVGKKIPGEMARQHIKFVEGCIEHAGMTKDAAEGLWKLFEPFQGYGFNKAHAASYGLVAYQTAYMKANYPVEYMTALMTAESGDTSKISAAVSECRRMGIKVLFPDINESNVGFTVVKNEESLNGKAVRFGLSAIKNVGQAAIENIIQARTEAPFVSLMDFFARVDSRKVNKRVMESLIKVGALERYGSRNAILTSLDELRSKARPMSAHGQQGLFAEEDKKAMESPLAISQIASDIPEFSEDELEDLERDLLGFSLSAKPIIEQIEELVPYRNNTAEELIEGGASSSSIRVAGIVSTARVVITKKTSSEMAFVTIEDETGEIDLVVFPKIFTETRTIWEEFTPVLVSGKLDKREDGTSILVDTVDTIDSIRDKSGKFVVTVPKGTGTEKLKDLKSILKDHPGGQSVSLIFEGNGEDEIKVPFTVSWNKDLSTQISRLFETR